MLTLDGLGPRPQFGEKMVDAVARLRVQKAKELLADPTLFFITAPPAGQIRPVRIWALGDGQ